MCISQAGKSARLGSSVQGRCPVGTKTAPERATADQEPEEPRADDDG